MRARSILTFAPLLMMLALVPDSARAQESESEAAPEREGEAAEAAEAAEASAPAPDRADVPDLAPLRADFDALMDELIATRARVAVVGRQVFETRLVVKVINRTGRSQNLTSLGLRLDGAPIFEADSGNVGADDARQVFEGFAAPGPHALGVELEIRAREGDAYRSSRSDTYRLQVVEGKLTEVTILIDDSSDIAESFPESEDGQYDTRVRVRVLARELREDS